VAAIRAFDHVGITVTDLTAATEFFLRLGLEVDGPPMAVTGEFLDTVIGMSNAHTRIVMLRVPGGSTTVELSSFVTPAARRGPAAPMANEVGLRSIAFQVDDLHATVDRLAADGHELIGGIGEYENVWRMAYVRGPDAIIVALAERIG
jgi:catechol 2,3-dioxygenase-like lactoylglutathione lyase family enzyme